MRYIEQGSDLSAFCVNMFLFGDAYDVLCVYLCECSIRVRIVSLCMRTFVCICLERERGSETENVCECEGKVVCERVFVSVCVRRNERG